MAEELEALRAERARRLESELERIVSELRAMGAKLIVLFGSFAAGRRDLFTDLDLLVVMESDLPFVRRIPALLERLHPQVATDLLV